MIRRVLVGEAPIDVAGEMTALRGIGVGAQASFIGIVRPDVTPDGQVDALHLEHWPGVTERALHALADEAASRWPLAGATIVHRVGTMVPGEAIVLVLTASAHRAAALDACAFLIDRLKADAPFWKREHRPAGAAWVEARGSDGAAAARWSAGGG